MGDIDEALRKDSNNPISDGPLANSREANISIME